ncbi:MULTISPECIES: DUF5993 family protein [Rhodomicrobium]|uniref:DUF5993 family protein n=1 Tax=Rhodomicrobium TaxID=1068 RepID=UPI001482CFD3|nr:MULTISPECIES: DUF5993 family protein [Rhodomicrobium]
MEFAVLFLVFTIALCLAFWGRERVALWVFSIGMVGIAALYRHHATDVLTLSF